MSALMEEKNGEQEVTINSAPGQQEPGVTSGMPKLVKMTSGFCQPSMHQLIHTCSSLRSRYDRFLSDHKEEFSEC